MELPDGAADLYGLPLGEFVAARTALAKRLRGEKRREEAAVVAKLRKPTVASWALDQVARSQPDLVAEALRAGDALLAATGRAMEGDASELREASAADRAASRAVLRAAAGHLAGGASAHRDRMAATLRAAVLDPAVRGELVAGTLVADHEPPAVGFGEVGTMAGVEPAAPARRTPSVRSTPKVGQRTDELAVRRAARASRDVARQAEEQEAQAEEQEARERAAQRAAEERAAEERAAEERALQLQVLRATADDARRAADGAAERAREAADRAAEARALADQAEREAAAAQEQAAAAAQAADDGEAAVAAFEPEHG